MWKQVQFDLTDNMGDAPQLPPDMASFLEWPEDATNEWGDAQSPSSPMAACPPIWPEMTMPKREGDWWCSTTAREARHKSSAAFSAGSTAAGGAGPNATPCQTQSNSQRTGSGCTLWGWGNHLTGGWSSSLCSGIVQESSPWPSYSSWSRDRLQVSDFLQPKPKCQVDGILHPVSVSYAAMISSCLGTSRAPGTSRRQGKRKPYPWPRSCSAVPNGLTGHIAWRVVLSGSPGLHGQSDVVGGGGCPGDPATGTHRWLTNSIPNTSGRGCAPWWAPRVSSDCHMTSQAWRVGSQAQRCS